MIGGLRKKGGICGSKYNTELRGVDTELHRVKTL